VPNQFRPPDFDPPAISEEVSGVYCPLHAALSCGQRALFARRQYALAEAHADKLPDYLPPSVATRIPGASSCPPGARSAQSDDCPADDADLVVKMLNSGAPGVMLDLEDSTANAWK